MNLKDAELKIKQLESNIMFLHDELRGRVLLLNRAEKERDALFSEGTTLRGKLCRIQEIIKS